MKNEKRSEITKGIREFCKATRLEKGYSLKTLAEKAGVAKNTLYDFEKNANNTGIDDVAKIFKHIDCEINVKLLK